MIGILFTIVCCTLICLLLTLALRRSLASSRWRRGRHGDQAGGQVGSRPLLSSVPSPIAGAITGAALWFLNAAFAYHDADVMAPYSHPVTSEYLISSAPVTSLAGGTFGAVLGARGFVRAKLQSAGWALRLGYGLAYVVGVIASAEACVSVLHHL